MHVHVSLYAVVTCKCKRTSQTLELKLLAAMNCLTWTLRTELGSFTRAVYTFNFSDHLVAFLLASCFRWEFSHLLYQFSFLLPPPPNCLSLLRYRLSVFDFSGLHTKLYWYLSFLLCRWLVCELFWFCQSSLTNQSHCSLILCSLTEQKPNSSSNFAHSCSYSGLGYLSLYVKRGWNTWQPLFLVYLLSSVVFWDCLRM